MNKSNVFRTLLYLLLVALGCAFRQTDAQEPGTQSSFPNAGASDSASADTGLAADQRSIAERFSRLEDLLLRSSELESMENPTRAALLQQAAQLGKQAQLADLLSKAAGSLQNDQLSEAIDQQRTSRASLQRLLEMLQSENREERVREERDTVRRWIEETDRLLRLQGSLRGRTEGGQDTEQAAGDQGKLSRKAADIAKELGGESQGSEQADENPNSNEDGDSDSKPASQGSEPTDEPTPADASKDGADPKGEAGKQGDSSQPTESSPKSPGTETDKSDENIPGSESSKQVDEPSDVEPKAGDGSKELDPAGKQSKDGKEGESPGENQPASGSEQAGQQSDDKAPNQQGQSQQGQSQPQQGAGQDGQSEQAQQPQSPTERAKQRIEQAQEKMKQAQKDLENAEREGAIEKQREAEANLREAIEQLEEILRQLREEEIERSLASLETRLRRMLEMQIKVLDETKRLNEITSEGTKDRQVEIRASNLSLEERKILAEGERAYLLLREEGSSAAFPEAIEQLNADIGNVADRLGQADVGKLTLLIEEEIVSSLEEMVDALVQVQKENKEKQQQQQQGQPQQGQPGDQPLVDKLAELRLIKTLQVRINKRTQALAEMLDDPTDSVGQGTGEEVLGELRGLSARQASIQNVTRDIVVGKGE